MMIGQDVPRVHDENMIRSGEIDARIAGFEATEHESRATHRIRVVCVEAFQCLVTFVGVHLALNAREGMSSELELALNTF